MPRITISGCRLATFFLILALVGCGGGTPSDNLPRTAVSGSVTLDGQPLAQGNIAFDPAERGPGTTQAIGEIKDGKFSIEKTLGPVPGKYKVSISSIPPVAIAPGEDPGTRPKMDPEKVPAQYNIKTTMTQEVAAGSPPLTFDLKSR